MCKSLLYIQLICLKVAFDIFGKLVINKDSTGYHGHACCTVERPLESLFGPGSFGELGCVVDSSVSWNSEKAVETRDSVGDVA